MSRSHGATVFALALLLPAILYILAIVAYPLVETVNLSFTDAALKPVTNWVGLQNYGKIFNAKTREI